MLQIAIVEDEADLAQQTKDITLVTPVTLYNC